MSEEINIKFYDPEVEELRKENQQLKEKLNCDLEWALKYDELYKENQQLKGKLKLAEHNKEQSEIQCRRFRNKRKTLNHRIKRREMQRDRYKSVLDEIREKVEKLDYDKFVYTKTRLKENKKEILQILDKVKE